MFGTEAVTRGLTFTKVLTGINKTLSIVNQAIPIYQQAKPMIQNARSAFRLLREFSIPDNKAKTNESPKQIATQSTEKKTISSPSTSNQPVFFV